MIDKTSETKNGHDCNSYDCKYAKTTAPKTEPCKHENTMQGNPNLTGELLIGQLSMEWCETCGKIFWITTFDSDNNLTILWKPEQETQKQTRLETAKEILPLIKFLVESLDTEGLDQWEKLRNFEKKYEVE